MELQDKIAVVTGAGRGMGRAISLQLADAGAHVAVSDINAENVEETSVAVKALGRESLAVHADMGNVADIDRMITLAKDDLRPHRYHGQQCRRHPPHLHHGRGGGRTGTAFTG